MKKITLLAIALTTSFTFASAQSIWTLGHGDIGIGYDTADGFEPHWHIGEDDEDVVIDGTAQSFGDEGTEFETDELILRFTASEPRSVDPDFAFLGVAAGQPVWILPETSIDSAIKGVPFLGFGTEELSASDWSGPITLTLTSITGSGITAGGFFSVYSDPFNILVQTFNGISSADVISLDAADHVHFNVAFTQPGIYNVAFAIAGTHTVDGAVTGAGTWTFEVIPEPATTLLLALGGGAMLLRRRRSNS